MTQATTSTPLGITTSPVLESTQTTLLVSILTPEVVNYQQEFIAYIILYVGCAEVGVSTQYYEELECTRYQRDLENLRAHWGNTKTALCGSTVMVTTMVSDNITLSMFLIVSEVL